MARWSTQPARPACKIRANIVGQSVATATELPVVMNTVDYNRDTNLYTTDVSTNYTITVNKAGTYVITGAVRFAAGAAGERSNNIAVNGTSVMEFNVPAAVGVPVSLPMTMVTELAAGDVVSLRVYTVSDGSGITIDSNSARSVWLTVSTL